MGAAKKPAAKKTPAAKKKTAKKAATAAKPKKAKAAAAPKKAAPKKKSPAQKPLPSIGDLTSTKFYIYLGCKICSKAVKQEQAKISQVYVCMSAESVKSKINPEI